MTTHGSTRSRALRIGPEAISRKPRPRVPGARVSGHARAAGRCRAKRDRKDYRVLLAPELAPGRVELGPGIGPEGLAGGMVVLGAGIAPELPLVAPAPGVAVLGVVAGVAVPGVVAGVAVPGVVVGVAVPGATVPGAALSVVRSGFVVVVPGGGGPASGVLIGGVLVVLAGSAGLAAVPRGPDSSGPMLGFASGLSGVRSFAPGAFGPNGLRPSIGPFCASVAPAQVIRAYAGRSAILTSAGADRSAASASSTTTGCKNTMAHPLYEMLLSPSWPRSGGCPCAHDPSNRKLMRRPLPG